MLDPFVDVRQPENEQYAKTMVRFSEGNPILCTGDVKGGVNIYRLNGKFIIVIYQDMRIATQLTSRKTSKSYSIPQAITKEAKIKEIFDQYII